MKKNVLLYLAIISLAGCTQEGKKPSAEDSQNKQIVTTDSTDTTNDFYDNAETYALRCPEIMLEGEIANSGKIEWADLPLRTLIVKEALLDKDGNRFIGAYRYDGYSLYDILNHAKLQKANAKEFNPIIDLYVSVENEKGEKALVSWGEIYYPNQLHNIIIAVQVTRIVPSKTKDLWPLPEESKLIIASDLITERNIAMPSKIVVKSFPKSFKTIKGMKPLYSPKLTLYNQENSLVTLTDLPENIQLQTYNSVFYGRGRGIHSTTPFTGIMLKELLTPYFEMNRLNLMNALFVIVAEDGYRSVFTFSEIMNRNDQSEVLLICNPELKDNGVFRIFPACDFFSDRAVKGINAIYFSLDD